VHLRNLPPLEAALFARATVRWEHAHPLRIFGRQLAENRQAGQLGQCGFFTWMSPDMMVPSDR
jgi:hypothetical protein